MVCRATKYIRATLLHLRHNSILIAWLILISFIFWSSYSRYLKDPKYFYLREILGRGLLFSRAMGSVVNISCFMVIIPMCRSFTTYIRIIGSKVSAKFVLDLIDASRKFHVTCAFTILFAGSFHSAAHIINAMNFSAHYNSVYKDINMAKFKGEDPLNSVIGTVPGITGVLMIVILCILSSAAVKYVRNISYDLFWYSHHLFLIFFILLISHPMSGLLKEQNNVLAHPPGCKMNISDTMEKHSLQLYQICTEPIFISQNSMTWRWVFAGLTIYIVDLCFRLFRRRCHVKLLGFQAYNSQLISLKLSKKGFIAQPGQYVYLQCPHISFLEWHPFSISQCPTSDDPSFTLHLRTDGDWSEYLKHHLLNEKSEKVEDMRKCNIGNIIYLCSGSLNNRLFVDGPYSSCFEDVLRYSVSICIAGGIGFTPFASVLRYLRIDVKRISKIKRLHFLWICREVEVFSCFSKLLSEMFELVWINNHPDKFELYLYLTKRESWDTIKNVLQDSFPFLKPRIQFGRPHWNVLFEQWANTYKKTDVGVFCCGPQLLNHEIKLLSHKWNTDGCKFVYHNETFS